MKKFTKSFVMIIACMLLFAMPLLSACSKVTANTTNNEVNNEEIKQVGDCILCGGSNCDCKDTFLGMIKFWSIYRLQKISDDTEKAIAAIIAAETESQVKAIFSDAAFALIGDTFIDSLMEIFEGEELEPYFINFYKDAIIENLAPLIKTYMTTVFIIYVPEDYAEEDFAKDMTAAFVLAGLIESDTDFADAFYKVWFDLDRCTCGNNCDKNACVNACWPLCCFCCKCGEDDCVWCNLCRCPCYECMYLTGGCLGKHDDCEDWCICKPCSCSCEACTTLENGCGGKCFVNKCDPGCVCRSA